MREPDDVIVLADGTRIPFYSYSEEDAERDAEAFGADLAGLPDGTSEWRLLPNLTGGSIFQLIWNHYIPDGPHRFVFACPNKHPEMGIKGCPACKFLTRMGLVPGLSPQAQKALEDMKPSPRAAVNAVCLQGPDANPDKAVALGISYGLWKDLVKLRRNPYTGGNFDHPVTGSNIFFTKSGKDLATRYRADMARSPSPLRNPAVVGQQVNLKNLVKFPEQAVVLEKLEILAEAIPTMGDVRGPAPGGTAPALPFKPRGASGEIRTVPPAERRPPRGKGRSIEDDLIDADDLPND